MTARFNPLAADPSRSSPATTTPLLFVGPSHEDRYDAGELLGALDDAMFAAIAGDKSALATARRLWPAALESLSTELIIESREQYAHFALEQSLRFERGDEADDASLVAIEVLTLLAGG